MYFTYVCVLENRIFIPSCFITLSTTWKQFWQEQRRNLNWQKQHWINYKILFYHKRFNTRKRIWRRKFLVSVYERHPTDRTWCTNLKSDMRNCFRTPCLLLFITLLLPFYYHHKGKNCNSTPQEVEDSFSLLKSVSFLPWLLSETFSSLEEHGSRLVPSSSRGWK